jgi:XRE family transcriptional regulator, regulator of sulfur utilization
MALFTIMPDISTLSIYNTVFARFIDQSILAILGIMTKSQENKEVLLGRRIRTLRTLKGWTQQELGNKADVNYKFIGEIERGQQNPSFNILAKIASALEVKLLELFRFEHEIFDRIEIEKRIEQIIKTIPTDSLRDLLSVLEVLYPTNTLPK